MASTSNLAKRIIPCLDVTAGRAIYDGTLDFATAQEEADRLTQT